MNNFQIAQFTTLSNFDQKCSNMISQKSAQEFRYKLYF